MVLIINEYNPKGFPSQGELDRPKAETEEVEPAKTLLFDTVPKTASVPPPPLRGTSPERGRFIYGAIHILTNSNTSRGRRGADPYVYIKTCGRDVSAAGRGRMTCGSVCVVFCDLLGNGG